MSYLLRWAPILGFVPYFCEAMGIATVDPEYIVQIKDLKVFFDRDRSKIGLGGIDLNIRAGAVTALIGASGSGKSITSLALMGLLPAGSFTEGSILFEGKNLCTLPESEFRKLRGSRISMIFQEPMSALNPLMTCGDQILESIQLHQQCGKQEARAKTIYWLEQVLLPDPELTFDKYPHQLSGGQKQRIMIAMAMANNPSLLIADEPSTALDVLVQKEIVSLLLALRRAHGTSILFITHDLDLAHSIADFTVEMSAGQIVNQSERIAAEALPQGKIEEEIILKVDKLSVAFGMGVKKVLAVDQVSLALKSGERVGLVGGSGCGKTTLSKAILGMLPTIDGEIFLKEKKINGLSAKQWKPFRKDIQIIFQDPYASLNPRMKVGEAIAEPMRIHLGYHRTEAKRAAEDWLERVQLQAGDYNKYPHEFSGGQRQRICIARALAAQPSLVICDESVAALDPTVQAQVLHLLKNLQEKLELTYLFITHDLDVVRRFCNRVLVMQGGKILEEGLTDNILLHPQEDYTKRLIDAMPARYSFKEKNNFL